MGLQYFLSNRLKHKHAKSAMPIVVQTLKYLDICLLLLFFAYPMRKLPLNRLEKGPVVRVPALRNEAYNAILL